jgi:hypothetical protein
MKRIADNASVALTLMIAESKPDEKDMMVFYIQYLQSIYDTLFNTYKKHRRLSSR